MMYYWALKESALGKLRARLLIAQLRIGVLHVKLTDAIVELHRFRTLIAIADLFRERYEQAPELQNVQRGQILLPTRRAFLDLCCR